MQFAFKRPTTTNQHRQYQPQPTQTHSQPKNNNSQLLTPADLNKKWELAAQKINKEMVLQKIILSNGQPFRMLTKIGGKNYNSQPKLISSEQSKNRIRIFSKEKITKNTAKESRVLKQAEQQNFRFGQSGQSKIKKKKRNDKFRSGMTWQKQIAMTNLFYESPIVKIGYNMQYDSFLRFQHISEIRPDHRTNINKNNIIYFLKDAPFSPNIISEKNQEIPISLSLFPEFFDSKLSESSKKRRVYFQKMLANMNNTYDPERMSLMPKYSSFPPFNPKKYLEAIQNISNGNEQNYKVQWLQNIIKKLRIKLTVQQFRELLEQQWQLFNVANAMITIDYILKDPKIAKRLQFSPYMATRISTSKNILYHGGYCQSLYVSWNSYVNKGKKMLTGHIKKYNPTNQSIHDWYSNFQNICLYENNFFHFLVKPVNIELFKKIHGCKLKHCVYILKNIWFRGVLSIYHFGRFLMKKEGEYENIIRYSATLESYIKEVRGRASQLNSIDEINHLYISFYENFLKSLHKESSVSCLEELLPSKNIDQFKPSLKNTEVMLNIQLGSTIQRSFKQFKNQLLSYSKPIIRMHLVIDRQSIKFLEQEQDIVNAFLQIIKNMLAVKIVGFKLECNFQRDRFAQTMDKMRRNGSHLQKNEKDNYNNGVSSAKETSTKYYPQIYEHSQHNSLQQSSQLQLYYKTGFTLQEDIKEILQAVKEYYKECYIAINQFEIYLPFIKLTTTQKIFGQVEGSSIQQNFQKNLKIIAKYKLSVRALQKNIQVNIFEVDCSIPIKILQERINEIEYMIEQNYINIIHEKIEQVDSELNLIKITAYNISLSTLTIEQIEEKFIQMKYELKLLQVKCRKIAEMIMFCFENKRKIEGIVNYYHQLISKKQDLQKDIEKMIENLQQKRPQIQSQIQQQTINIIKDIQSVLQNVTDMETVCFEYANISEYLLSLKDLKIKFDKIMANIQKYEEFIMKSHQKYDLQAKISLFNHQKSRFELMIQYWEQFYIFQQFYKQVSKQLVRKIDFREFQIHVKTSLQVIHKIKNEQQKWWNEIKDKSQWRPIIHKTHQIYIKKFANDVDLSQKLMPKLQILTNFKIRQRHWSFYSLSQFKDISFKDLSKLKVMYKADELYTMDEQVNFQYQIYLAYQDIQNKIKNHRLIIIDLNDSDILDLNNIKECIEFLYNVQIDIEELIQKDINKYYHNQLEELFKLAKITESKLVQWGIVQQKYIKFLKFHITNEDYQANHFDKLVQLHRKLIKSYDIDNTLLFISKNLVMDAYLSDITAELSELQMKISQHLSNISMNYPRLYLLNHEQLFQFVSEGANIKKYLKKCFYWINDFTIKDGSIEKIGLKRQLTFAQPFYIQEMIGRVYTWMNTLQELIKGRMREYFKTSSIILEEKSSIQLEFNFYENYPIQLSILDECISFTAQAEEAINLGNLKQLYEQLLSKIVFLSKEKKELHKILLLMNFRDTTKKMSISSSQINLKSFQWLKYPRFYKRSHLEAKVSFLNQENSYAFNFLQGNEIIFTDNVLIGNCLIGPSKYGKTSLIKYQAYLCGQQTLIFDPRAIQNQENCTSNLFSYLKVNSFSGNWLLVQRIDLLEEEQLKLLAQCMIVIEQNVKMMKSNIILSGNKVIFNKHSRIFMSSASSDNQLPARLCVLLRPIWMVKPSKKFLIQMYVKSKCFNSSQITKLMRFCQEADSNCNISLDLINWIRKEQNLRYFLANNSQIYPEGNNLMLSSKVQSSNHRVDSTQKTQKSLQKEVFSADKRDIMVYGQKSTGKTYEILSILKNQKYIILNINQNMEIAQLFSIITKLKCQQNRRYLILKNGVRFYPFIRKNIDLQIILIQNSLANIQFGLFHDLKMINFILFIQHQPINPHKDEQLKYFRLLVPKILQEPTFSGLSSIFTSDNLFTKSLKRFFSLLQLHQRVNQVHINFLSILKAMITSHYQIAISFLYALFWTYGMQMQQKRFYEEIKNVMKESEMILAKTRKNVQNSVRILQEKFIKLMNQTFNNKLLSFTELIPCKNGKFAKEESEEIKENLSVIEIIPEKTVTLKSNLIYNIKLLRQMYEGTITLECRDWLSTILKFSKAKREEINYFNLRGLSMSEIANKMFDKMKRNGISIRFPQNITIVIDDIQLGSKKVLHNLGNLSQNKFTIYSEGTNHEQAVNMIKLSSCRFIFGSKGPNTSFSKALTLRIAEKNINSIFNEYITSFCERYIQIDCSLFLLINLSNSINRNYRDSCEQAYFWFKNPLIILQHLKIDNISQMKEHYISYLVDLLPDQKEKLIGNRQLLDLPSVQAENMKDMLNPKASFNQRALIDKLMQDNEILQEIQSKQIESIFFQKFVNSYFTQKILQKVQKISQKLQFYHLIMLSDNYTHITRIVKYACKISKLNLVYYNESIDYNMPDTVVYINLDQLSFVHLQKLQSYIKSHQSDSHFTKIIIKADIHSQNTKRIFSQFTFLKAYFWIMLTQNLGREILPIISTAQISSSKNIIDFEYESDCKVQEQLNQIAVKHNLNDNFKEEFMKTFENCRKDQIASFKFHRKITSEMVLNIDTIDNSFQEIPEILLEYELKKIQMEEIKAGLSDQRKQLKIKLIKWQQKQKCFSELIRYRQEEQHSRKSKLSQNCASVFSKLQKIEKRVQAIEAIQFTRLRNNLKNNESASLIQPLHLLLASIHQKGENLSKQKLNQSISNFLAAPLSLVNYIKTIRKRQEADIQISKNNKGYLEEEKAGKISSAMMSKLKGYLNKIEEINENGKKYEKLSLIYKSLVAWMSIYQSHCQNLLDYYVKEAEMDNRLSNELSNINKKYQEETDIQYQKLHLQVLKIESQNKVEEIKDQMKKISKEVDQIEVERSALQKKEVFYAQRRLRLQRITMNLSKHEYIKKISSGVSLYFKNIDNIIFSRALLIIKLNQEFPTIGINLYELFRDIFTFKIDLLAIRQKYKAQSLSFEQMQIIKQSLDENGKRLSLIQDRHNMIKGKLIEIAQDKGYLIKQLKHSSFKEVIHFIKHKIHFNQKIILVNQNIYYLETTNAENEAKTKELIQELIEIQQLHTSSKIIYLTNYLPKINTDFYHFINFGKMGISRQKFITDVSEIFNLVQPSDRAKQKEIEKIKRRSNIENILSQKNRKLKEIISNIESLCKKLKQNRELEEIDQEQVQNQRDFCNTLENNLLELAILEEQLSILEFYTTNYNYQSAKNKQIIKKQLSRYFAVCLFTDFMDIETNNQFFTSQQFYSEWIKLLRTIREQKIMYFSGHDFRPIINEIVIKSIEQEQQTSKTIKPTHKTKVEEESNNEIQKVFNLNTTFIRYNNEVFNYLIDKMIKNTNWISRESLIQYILGVCLIRTFSNIFLSRNDFNFFQTKVRSEADIIEECVRLSKSCNEQVKQININTLMEQLLAIADEQNHVVSCNSQEIIIFYYLYLLISIKIKDERPKHFIHKFSTILKSKRTKLSQKYSFLKDYTGIKLQSELIISISSSQSLTINFENKLVNEKMITIIEQEKHLINELVQTLKIKALSKKREFVVLFAEGNKPGKLIQEIKDYYKNGNKYWLYLANLQINPKNSHAIRCILQQITSELKTLLPNTFFRIFIVIPRTDHRALALYYNKYEINRFICYHSIFNEEYFKIINQNTLDSIQNAKNKNKSEDNQSFGRQLIETFILTVTKQEELNHHHSKQLLQNLSIYFSKMMKKLQFFAHEDRKIYYKNIVNELVKMGYLRGQQNEKNFYCYLSEYFKMVTGNSSLMIEEYIGAYKELNKEGLDNTFMIVDRESNKKEVVPEEIINLAKLQESLRNNTDNF